MRVASNTALKLGSTLSIISGLLDKQVVLEVPHFFKVSSHHKIPKSPDNNLFTSRLISILHLFYLKDTENLLHIEGLVCDRHVLKHIEFNSLRERSALANSDYIAFTHVLKGRGTVN